MNELSDELYNAIVHEMKEGDSAFEKDFFNSALKHYEYAEDLIPNPHTDWEIALHVYVALGDCYFNLENYESANYCYNRALLCPDGIGCGYVWLGLGESLYELNRLEEAKDALMRAYILEGEDIFEDEKYFDIIKEVI